MIYISFVPLTEKGVLKKIEYQVNALKRLGINSTKLEIIDGDYYLCKKKIGKTFEKNNLKDKIWRKFSTIKYLSNLKNKNFYENRNLIYIRNFGSSPWFISYLKYLKKLNKKIILEIPTYPYDKECSKFNIFHILDKIFRKKLYKYVDKIVTYSEDEKIWGIPCINISNGIDLNEVQKKIENKIESGKIVFTSVSNCSIWHGIDRFINSLEEYGKNENKKKIKFNIIGEGSELINLKNRVSKSDYLSGVVKFWGFRNGQELDKIYNNTNIGVGSLGIHRIGLTEVQPLKNREYTAKGLPFVISFIDPEFKDKNYVYKVESNEEMFDIKKLINWYENSNFNSNLIREDSKRFTWDIQMKKVLDSI